MATRLTNDPARYGVTIGAAAIFQGLRDSYAAAYTTATEDISRTPTAIVVKDTAKEALIKGPGGIRELVDVIQARPETTNEMRSELQITIRQNPSPVPVPQFAPGIEIVSNFAHTLKIRLRDTEFPDNKGKPVGVAYATVLSFVGEDPPQNYDDWTMQGNATRTRFFDVVFPTTVALGSKVWVTAFWCNPRGDSGPGSTPLAAHISYEGMQKKAG